MGHILDVMRSPLAWFGARECDIGPVCLIRLAGHITDHIGEAMTVAEDSTKPGSRVTPIVARHLKVALQAQAVRITSETGVFVLQVTLYGIMTSGPFSVLVTLLPDPPRTIVVLCRRHFTPDGALYGAAGAAPCFKPSPFARWRPRA